MEEVLIMELVARHLGLLSINSSFQAEKWAFSGERGQVVVQDGGSADHGVSGSPSRFT
jgi:hypothetical protein